jgi:hypothetical protein
MEFQILEETLCRCSNRQSGTMSSRRNFRRVLLGAFTGLGLWVLACEIAIPAPAQSQPQVISGTESGAPDAPQNSASAAGQQPGPESLGSISGTVVDQAGAVAAGARVRLTRGDSSPAQEVISGENGQFFFASVPPGPFQLTVTAEGFETRQVAGSLSPGEASIVAPITLAVATVVTDVQVGFTQAEVAQDQIKEQEQQRVLGFIPNFYVSYDAEAVPLNAHQKFELAWRTTIDPFTFVGVGALAGVQQATDDFEGYGQGALGYAKRFGAGYADVMTGTYIGSAILPTLLKQDPRYFYKGTGTARSRLLYAVANTVICKGDNKRWQANYSGILGILATGGISYLYYPADDRSGTELIVQNSLVRLSETALTNVLQEFIVKKLTPHLKTHTAAHP